jgi:exodeoxyribonuclease VII large subunit
VAACTTPVVSAIGHEEDQPLLDLVADLRASTPTDAAKRVIPDVVEEATKVRDLRDRGRSLVQQLLRREVHGLAAVRTRPALAQPDRLFDHQLGIVMDLNARGRRCLGHHLDRAGDDLAHRLARVRSLSPLATLERGYCVVQTADGAVLTDADGVTSGDGIDVRLARGRIRATVVEPTGDPFVRVGTNTDPDWSVPIDSTAQVTGPRNKTSDD